MNIKSKKYYTAPKIGRIKLDREISLIMMTNPPPDPGALISPPSTQTDGTPPSSNSTPFGGDSPDYGDM